MEKTYDFEATEEKIYNFWEKNGYFQPINDPNKPEFDPSIEPYAIAIPPPNVTGELHLGHVMFVALEDLMIRYQRMKGLSALWIPGSDHAGIATQVQIEKLLVKEDTSREEIGREEFEKRTWDWKDKYGDIITYQIRRLGASCDWSRERFTLDEGLSKAVREAFVHLYNKGLIYKGLRLINWSPELKTAISDLEVEYHEEEGTLYYFKYMINGIEGAYIPVATTRPETILGDTAVAVHPEDKRYQKYIGKTALVPILNREIPIISDEYVDMEFGTGALKITPGHDPNDYEIGLRHNLESISILDKDAKLNRYGGKYQGLDRFVCREVLWSDMKADGLVIKEEPYTINIPRSQRSHEIIEPMLSTQWFMKMDSLAEAALKAVEDGRIKIVPPHFEKVYNNWLNNIQDWCISRQLWWGHRIPVWYCADCNNQTVQLEDPSTCIHCKSTNIKQDPDVLDTWFSSGLWPFSSLGWPVETPDFNYFYPTTMMETGYDILFFWVARMIMLGIELTGEVPFCTVYLHGLVRDKNGMKLSKSFGNSIDPLEIMDELGTDALRFTLLVGSTPGKDSRLNVNKVIGNRNFSNKIWNASRFVTSKIPHAPIESINPPDWTLADSWIWAILQDLIRQVNKLFENHQYGEAGRQIYDFFWSEFADWYLEIAKHQLNDGGDRAYYTMDTLIKITDVLLRMLHPFIPFVTEEIWQSLRKAALEHPAHFSPQDGWEDALIVATWPNSRIEEGWEEDKITAFEEIREIVRGIRNLRSENNIQPKLKLPAFFVVHGNQDLIKSQLQIISNLSRLDIGNLSVAPNKPELPDNYLSIVFNNLDVYIPIRDIIDPNAEKSRITKELLEVQSQIDRLTKLLNSSFAEKAPPKIVDKEREKLNDFIEKSIKLKDQID